MQWFKKMRERPWAAYATAGCLIILFYLILSHLNVVWYGIRTIVGCFSTVIWGAAMAYVMDSLAKLYQRLVFRRVKKRRLQWKLSVFLAVITVLLLISLLFGMLIPQLIESISAFISNLQTYSDSLELWINQLGLSNIITGADVDSSQLVDVSESIITQILSFLSENGTSIIERVTSTGKTVIEIAIAFIISVYLMLDKARIQRGLNRLTRLLFRQSRFDFLKKYMSRCDGILTRYITFNLLDALIVGVANAIFMLITGMPYIGLVSFICGVTNLIPTFGPIVGLVIGAFVLLLVNPVYSLIFIIFTLILQFCDGYVLKPRLFGSSMGVSGTLIIIGIVVGSKMFGVIGILLATPFMGILDFTVRENIIPAMEHRRAQLDKQLAEDDAAKAPEQKDASRAPEQSDAVPGNDDPKGPAPS